MFAERTERLTLVFTPTLIVLRMFFRPGPLFGGGGDCTSGEEHCLEYRTAGERWCEWLVTEAVGKSGVLLPSRIGGKSEYSSDSDLSCQ
jgi:hypothetical protein